MTEDVYVITCRRRIVDRPRYDRASRDRAVWDGAVCDDAARDGGIWDGAVCDGEDWEGEVMDAPRAFPGPRRRRSARLRGRAIEAEAEADEDVREAVVERAAFGGFGFTSLGMVLVVVGLIAMAVLYYGQGSGFGFDRFGGPPPGLAAGGDYGSAYPGSYATAYRASGDFGEPSIGGRPPMGLMAAGLVFLFGAVVIAMSRGRGAFGGR